MNEPDFDAPDLDVERGLADLSISARELWTDKILRDIAALPASRPPRFTLAHALMLGGLALVLMVTLWVIYRSLRP